MHKLWEFLFLLVAILVVGEALLKVLVPLAPYLLGLIVVVGITAKFYHRYRNW